MHRFLGINALIILNLEEHKTSRNFMTLSMDCEEKILKNISWNFSGSEYLNWIFMCLKIYIVAKPCVIILINQFFFLKPKSSKTKNLNCFIKMIISVSYTYNLMKELSKTQKKISKIGTTTVNK